MSSVRLRRLNADFTNLSNYIRRHPRLRLIQTDGDPAERYQIEYRIRSLRQVEGELATIKSHIVEIALPRNYPRTPPQCRMLSPVFHPNIAPHAICVGDHWSAGESLQSIVTRIGEMLAYQSYNVKSPLNGEAARWVQEHEDELPLDRVSMMVDEDDAARPGNGEQISPQPKATAASTSPAKQHIAPPDDRRGPTLPARQHPELSTSESSQPEPRRTSSPQTAAEAVAVEKVVVVCSSCERRYKVPPEMLGRSASCSQCGEQFLLQVAGQ